jgi:hypothetical protein
VIFFLKEIEDFKKIIHSFETDQQSKLQDLPVFKKGVDFYQSQLKFDFGFILEELEADISRTKEFKNWNLKQKEAKVKELLEVLNFQNVKKFELGSFSQLDRIKTMRDLPEFGKTEKPINFRYPTDADLRAMPKDKPIEAIKLNWKPSSKNSSCIGAMQVIYSNGHASPVFLGKNEDANNLRTIALNSQIKKIRGTSSVNGFYVCNIHFQDKNGKEISKISAYEMTFAPD